MGTVTALPLDMDGYTIEDLEALPDDGLRYELDDGCLVVSPPPPTAHNMAATELAYLILSGYGSQFQAAADGALLFDSRNYRQPDLLMIRREGAVPAYAGPGDVVLALDVMSPSSVRRDRLVKPAQYAAAGIPHFWRLEPLDRVLVTYTLDSDVYRETGRFTDEVVIDEPVALRFRLAQLLD